MVVRRKKYPVRQRIWPWVKFVSEKNLIRNKNNLITGAQYDSELKKNLATPRIRLWLWGGDLIRKESDQGRRNLITRKDLVTVSKKCW